jgi:hypothetical protein
MVLTAGVYPTIHCYPQLDWTSVKDQSLWYSVTHRVNMITLLMSGTLIPFCRMSPFRQPWRNLSRPLSLTIPYINGVVHHSWSCGQDQSWRVSWPTKHPLAVFYHINLSGWHCMDYSVVQFRQYIAIADCLAHLAEFRQSPPRPQYLLLMAQVHHSWSRGQDQSFGCLLAALINLHRLVHKARTCGILS